MENSGSSQGILAPPIEGVAGGGTAYGWNDGILRNLNPVRGSIDPSEVPTVDLVHVWCIPSTANVGPQEMPRQMENINLLAARNERESVQIAIRPKVSWASSGIAGSVMVQFGDLCSTAGDRLYVGNSLTLRRVVQILGVPDALVPLDLPISQISLLPGETVAIWVSIDVPSEQPPGQYEGDIIITAVKPETESSTQIFRKADKYKLYKELQSCLAAVEPIDQKSMDEVVERVRLAATSLRSILLSPLFSEFSDNGPVDLMDEDAVSNSSLSIRLKINLTVWDFVLPVTPSLPAVFGISDTVIEDRFGVVHGSEDWYEALDNHFKWLLQFRISPYFCRWGDSMRVLTYTCPWPADHPKSDEYFSDPRLSAYAVPYSRPFSGDTSKEHLRQQVEILRSKIHWKKAYFYLWDEPLNLEQYDSIRTMASEIHAYAPDARVLTTYYSGPNDAPLGPTHFEAFVKVPKFLRPHTQIYCTSEWVLGNREDLAKDIISEIQPENGEEWWTYICMGPTDPHPNLHLGMRGTQHRAVMWRVWKEGGTGFLYWGANCYEKATVPSEELRFRHGLPPGDGVLFYPGEVFSSSHTPVASLRLERILSGLQDIEYLKLYASRYGREQGLALLEKTRVYFGPERYTLEHMPIDVMRGEIFQACRS